MGSNYKETDFGLIQDIYMYLFFKHSCLKWVKTEFSINQTIQEMMDILFNLDVDYISDYSKMRNLRLSILNVLLNNPARKQRRKMNDYPTLFSKYFHKRLC